jgi:lysophospholipase
MIPFDEEGFKNAVETTLKPWLAETVTGGKFTSFDGARIQYYRALNPNAKAVIVMVHGFCEFFGKFHEPAYNFWENGYSVYFIEQRGHGGSDRSVKEYDHVDVSDFSEYVEDLKTFLDKVVLPQTQGLFTRAAVAGGAGSTEGRQTCCGT